MCENNQYVSVGGQLITDSRIRTTIQFKSAFDRGEVSFPHNVINCGIISNIETNRYRATHLSKIPVKMKFLHLKNVFALTQYHKSGEQFVKRMKPLLLLFKICGIFANEIKGNRLKSCSWPYYSICVFWLSIYISYLYILLYYFLDLETIQVRIVIEFIKHLIGYISLSINVIATYTTQDGLIEVRRLKHNVA